MAGGLGQIEQNSTSHVIVCIHWLFCFLFFLNFVVFLFFCIFYEGRAISELARGDCQSYEFGAKAFAPAWSFSLSPHQEFAVLGRS